METARQPGHREVPRRRSAWLALAGDEALDPLRARLPPTTCLRIVDDRAAFRDALLNERPRLALACLPPGGDAEMALLASERRRRTGLRTVLLNERDDVETRLAALRLGFDECLEVGVSMDELAGRLRLLAERIDNGQREHRLAIADGLQLDLDAHVLLREGTPVHLRPKEFGLLEFLSRHPGRAYSAGTCSRACGVPTTAPTPARSTSTSAGCGPRWRTTPSARPC